MTSPCQPSAGFVSPNHAAKTAAAAQGLQFAQAHGQHAAWQLASAGVQLEAAGRRRNLAVADHADVRGLGRRAPTRRKSSRACVPSGRLSIAPLTSVSVCEFSAACNVSSAAESRRSASNGPQRPSSGRCKHCQTRSNEAASTSACEAVNHNVGRRFAGVPLGDFRAISSSRQRKIGRPVSGSAAANCS